MAARKSKPSKGKAGKARRIAGAKVVSRKAVKPAEFNASMCPAPPPVSQSNVGFYGSEVVSHFSHPHNYGKMKDPDAVGKAGNPVCGDVMEIFIKVDRASERITDIKFQTLGCAAAIATSSMVTDLAKGKTLSEALRITREDVAGSLGGLPPIKMHCSNLAAEALHNAIQEYRKRHAK